MIFLRETKEGLLLTVRVTPRSARDEIVGTHGGALKIRLNAPPVDGKANGRLMRFLGERLEVPLSRIQIVRGPDRPGKTGSGDRPSALTNYGVDLNNTLKDRWRRSVGPRIIKSPSRSDS